MNYWLIKLLLVAALAGITLFLVRPVRTDTRLALRRLGMLLLVVVAVFAILFPSWFNRFAQAVGVASGTNLLVYLLFVALLAQMASSYRREVALQRQITRLARTVALGPHSQHVSSPATDEGTPVTDADAQELRHSSHSQLDDTCGALDYGIDDED